MKRLIVIIGVLSLTAISLTKCNDSPQSNQSEIQPQSSPSTLRKADSVSKVNGLSAKASGPTVINLTWESVPNASVYWIYRDNHVVAIVTTANYTHRAKPSNTYNYEIAAVVNGVLGPKSRSVNVTTPR